jgi:hypothetical protein
VISSTGIYRNAFDNTLAQKIRPSEPPAASGSSGRLRTLDAAARVSSLHDY